MVWTRNDNNSACERVKWWYFDVFCQGFNYKYIYYTHTIFFHKECVFFVVFVVFCLDMFRLASNKRSLNINPDFSLQFQATCDLR